MAVPSESQLYRPILEIAAESGEVFRKKDFLAPLTERFSLTNSDLQERIATGLTRIMDRTDWATKHLTYAGLLNRPTRGRFQISPQGRDFLKTHQGEIRRATLRRLEHERKQQQDIEDSNQQVAPAPPTATATLDTDPDDERHHEADATLDEQIAETYHQLQIDLTNEMLDALKGVDPYQFERIVLDLLEKMGYGEVERDKWGGRGGDGGIDGVINQDPLGLEKVYVQAKRWQNTVGDSEIRDFSGSLVTRGASKGVFITTSDFSGAARQTEQNISKGNQQLIRLINGQELSRLMVEHGVGVVTENTYEVKKLDENYFSDSDDI